MNTPHPFLAPLKVVLQKAITTQMIAGVVIVSTERDAMGECWSVPTEYQVKVYRRLRPHVPGSPVTGGAASTMRPDPLSAAIEALTGEEKDACQLLESLEAAIRNDPASPELSLRLWTRRGHLSNMRALLATLQNLKLELTDTETDTTEGAST